MRCPTNDGLEPLSPDFWVRKLNCERSAPKVATRLSIRLTTSRRPKSVVNRDPISDRNTVGVVTTLSSSRQAAWRTNFTLRHSPLPPVYSLLTSQPHRFAVEGASAGGYQNYFCESGVSYFNPQCRDACTQIVRPQVPKPSSMIFYWKRSRLFAAFCRAARSMSGKFSIRSGTAGVDVAADHSRRHLKEHDPRNIAQVGSLAFAKSAPHRQSHPSLDFEFSRCRDVSRGNY